MPRILFWNVGKKDLRPLLCSLAATEADVLILCEDPVPPEETLTTLQSQVEPTFCIPNTLSEQSRFHCFSRYPSLDLGEVQLGFRTSTRLLQLENKTALLGIVHGIDMRNNSKAIRQSAAQDMADEFRSAVAQQANKRMIIIGDFNMNPFDQPMNVARGMNAMMTQACIKRGFRKFHNKTCDFFYNPMWNMFGDITAGPSGTVYNRSNQGLYGWSMLDQVLVHHAALSLFRSVKIVTMAGSTSLADKYGRPDKARVSDHFPIMVELE